MVTPVYEVERGIERAPAGPRVVSAIRWGAVFGGSVVGIAVYLVLTLLGIAAGFTAIDPQSAQPVGSVPLWTGIWGFISMLAGAFVGGWAAGRMSGLRRRMDGMLHGLTAWGLTALLFVYLTTTTMASLIGGTFNVFGQTVQTAGQVASETGGGVGGQLMQIITGTPGAPEVDQQALSVLQDRLSAGDRGGAIDVMVNQMGFSQERATQVVDQAMPLFSGGGETVEQAAETTTTALTAASWWLFATFIISLALGVWGGAIGSRGTSKRVWGNHADERHHTSA